MLLFCFLFLFFFVSYYQITSKMSCFLYLKFVNSQWWLVKAVSLYLLWNLMHRRMCPLCLFATPSPSAPPPPKKKQPFHFQWPRENVFLCFQEAIAQYFCSRAVAPDFSNPRFLEPPDNSNQLSFPLDLFHSNTVILPPISRTLPQTRTNSWLPWETLPSITRTFENFETTLCWSLLQSRLEANKEKLYFSLFCTFITQQAINLPSPIWYCWDCENVHNCPW